MACPSFPSLPQGWTFVESVLEPFMNTWGDSKLYLNDKYRHELDCREMSGGIGCERGSHFLSSAALLEGFSCRPEQNSHLFAQAQNNIQTCYQKLSTWRPGVLNNLQRETQNIKSLNVFLVASGVRLPRRSPQEHPETHPDVCVCLIDAWWVFDGCFIDS